MDEYIPRIRAATLDQQQREIASEYTPRVRAGQSHKPRDTGRANCGQCCFVPCALFSQTT